MQYVDRLHEIMDKHAGECQVFSHIATTVLLIAQPTKIYGKLTMKNINEASGFAIGRF